MHSKGVLLQSEAGFMIVWRQGECRVVCHSMVAQLRSYLTVSIVCGTT